MRRREFITLLGRAAAAWQLAARAQQADRVWRIGFLFGAIPPAQFASEGPAFTKGMRQLGYLELAVALTAPLLQPLRCRCRRVNSCSRTIFDRIKNFTLYSQIEPIWPAAVRPA
jgi:hypothetical protein